MSIEVGQQAPEFTLKDQSGNDVSLATLRENADVVLVFYPFTFSGICEAELCSLRDDLQDFADSGAQVVAVSCDSRHSQRIWSEQQSYSFPVLSDFWPHGAVAKAYGVFNDDLGCAIRATFVIDKSGVVIDAFATDSLATPRDQVSYKDALSKL